MRSTDPDPGPWQPLGERIPKAPPPSSKLLTPKPQGPYGIVVEDGKMRTTTLPEELKP